MAVWVGGCRFKVEEVNNGWVIEFHPRRIDETSSKTEKHVAQSDNENWALLEALKNLLAKQDQLDWEDQPTTSEQPPE